MTKGKESLRLEVRGLRRNDKRSITNNGHGSRGRTRNTKPWAKGQGCSPYEKYIPMYNQMVTKNPRGKTGKLRNSQDSRRSLNR